MDLTGALLLLFLVAVPLGVFGVYLVFTPDVAADLWADLKDLPQRLKQRLAARNARVLEATEAALHEQELSVEVPLPPEQVLALVVEHMTRQGWGVDHKSQSSVTFARDKGGSTCLGCFLMLFLLVPGLLYLLLRNRTARVTVAVYPHEGGARVTVGGENAGALANWVRGLAGEPVSLPLVMEESATYQEGTYQEEGLSTLAEKLRELAELRDAGLITAEEYEAKRKDLLDKM